MNRDTQLQRYSVPYQFGAAGNGTNETGYDSIWINQAIAVAAEGGNNTPKVVHLGGGHYRLNNPQYLEILPYDFGDYSISSDGQGAQFSLSIVNGKIIGCDISGGVSYNPNGYIIGIVKDYTRRGSGGTVYAMSDATGTSSPGSCVVTNSGMNYSQLGTTVYSVAQGADGADVELTLANSGGTTTISTTVQPNASLAPLGNGYSPSWVPYNFPSNFSCTSYPILKFTVGHSDSSGYSNSAITAVTPSGGAGCNISGATTGQIRVILGAYAVDGTQAVNIAPEIPQVVPCHIQLRKGVSIDGEGATLVADWQTGLFNNQASGIAFCDTAGDQAQNLSIRNLRASGLSVFWLPGITTNLTIENITGLFGSPGGPVADLRFIGNQSPTSPPALTFTTGGSLPAQTTYARTTFIYPNGETFYSPESTLSIAAGQQLVVSTPVATTATATANLAGTSVAGIDVVSNGLYYVDTPSVTISPPGGTGTPASATANLTNGMVTSIDVDHSGLGYSSAPTVTITPPPAITATGYNVYLSSTPNSERKQNLTPVSIASAYTLTTAIDPTGATLPDNNYTRGLGGGIFLWAAQTGPNTNILHNSSQMPGGVIIGGQWASRGGTGGQGTTGGLTSGFASFDGRTGGSYDGLKVDGFYSSIMTPPYPGQGTPLNNRSPEADRWFEQYVWKTQNSELNNPNASNGNGLCQSSPLPISPNIRQVYPTYDGGNAVFFECYRGISDMSFVGLSRSGYISHSVSLSSISQGNLWRPMIIAGVDQSIITQINNTSFVGYGGYSDPYLPNRVGAAGGLVELPVSYNWPSDIIQAVFSSDGSRQRFAAGLSMTLFGASGATTAPLIWGVTGVPNQP